MMDQFTELPQQVYETNISRLRLPTRIYRALLRANINTVGGLIPLLETDLSNVRGLGETAHSVIARTLTALRNAIDVDGEIAWPVYWAAQNLEPEVEAEAITVVADLELPESLMRLSLGHLHLPIRAHNALIRADIQTIGELITARNEGLYKVQNLGNNSITVIKINEKLLALAESVNLNNEVDWFRFWQDQQIIIIPQQYKQGSSAFHIIKQFPELVREILTQDKDDRDWRIIQRRFGLNGTTRLTLEELGEAFDLTRERVRQIEYKALVELQSVLIENQYAGYNYHVHPEILATIKALFDTLATQTKEFIVETELFDLVCQTLIDDIAKLRPILIMLFAIAGMSRIEFSDPDLTAVWTRADSDQRENLERVVTLLDNLLTVDIAVPMEDFDILRSVNKKLPREKRLSLLQLRRFIDLCSTVEQREDGLFWGKFEYLKSRGNQVERLLTEAGKPLSIAELTRVINSKLVMRGHRKLTEQNLTNQLTHDARFVPIGRSGYWALKAWDHINTSSIITLMERYLLAKNEPATAEEIFEYVSSLRPVSEASITFYLASHSKLFKKADRNRWGLSSWEEVRNAVTWSPEQVAAFVEDVFRRHKTHELEFKIIREALMKEAGLSSRQAGGLLIQNPAVVTRKGEGWTDRFAVFQPDYKEKLSSRKRQFTRKKATLRERIEGIVRKQLETAPGFQMPLADLITLLTSKDGFHSKTAYLYIRQAEFLETVTVPGTQTKICRLKDRHTLSFPQLSSITDANLRESIEKARVQA
jgi:hypothetical protein